MLEDITMSSSDSGQNPEKDLVTLYETSIKKTEKSSIICDWDPFSYKSEDRNNLINHIDEHIGKRNDTKHDIADVIVVKEDSKIAEKEAVSASEVEERNEKEKENRVFISYWYGSTCQRATWVERAVIL